MPKRPPGVYKRGSTWSVVIDHGRDAKTGKRVWHQQLVHHDIWDPDMPTAGALFDFVLNGKRTPAIAHVGKSSYVYVLDRTTGRPLIIPSITA